MKNLFFLTFFLFCISNLYSQNTIPDNFPNDVPLPKYSLYIGSLNTIDGGTLLTFESSQTVKENLDFYIDAMRINGFELVSIDKPLMIDTRGGIISWKKGIREVELMLGINYDTYRTAIVITYK